MKVKDFQGVLAAVKANIKISTSGIDAPLVGVENFSHEEWELFENLYTAGLKALGMKI